MQGSCRAGQSSRARSFQGLSVAGMGLKVKMKVMGSSKELRAGVQLQKRDRLREAWSRTPDACQQRDAEAWAAQGSEKGRPEGLRGIWEVRSVTLGDWLIWANERIVNGVTDGAVAKERSSKGECLGMKTASSTSNRWSMSPLWDIQVRVSGRW